MISYLEGGECGETLFLYMESLLDFVVHSIAGVIFIPDHEETLKLARRVLERRGYHVWDTRDRRTVIATPEGNPDLKATKDEETLWIEVKRDTLPFVKQIEGYSKLEGKTILLLGIDTSNIELWGIQDLEAEPRSGDG